MERPKSSLNRVPAQEIISFLLWSSFLHGPAIEKLLELQRSGSGSQPNQVSTDKAQPKRKANIFTRWMERKLKQSQDLAALNLPMRVNRLGLTFQIVSTLVELILLSQALLILILDPSATLTRHLKCYGPRIVMHHRVSQRFMLISTLSVNIFQIIWRILVFAYANGEFYSQMLPFLLAKEEVLIERFRQGGSKFRPGTNFDFLDRSLFYKIENGITGEMEFRARPNRCLKIRRRVLAKVEQMFQGSLVVSGLIIICTAPTAFYALLLKQQDLYPDCTMPTSPIIYTTRFIASSTISLIFLLNQCISLFFTPVLCYILVQDLVIHWRQVERKVMRLYLAMLEERDSATPRRYPGLENLVSVPERSGRTLARLANTTKEAQCLLADFFTQLSCVDRAISIYILYSMSIWLGMNVVYTVTDVQLNFSAQSDGIYLRLIQFIGAFVMVCLSAFILTIKRATEPLYAILCTLVALDRSRNKSLWLRLLDIYTEKPQRYAFTYLHGKIYTQMTLIRILFLTLTLAIALNPQSFNR